MKSADDEAENVDDAVDDSRRLDNSSSVDSYTYKTAKDESYTNQVKIFFNKFMKVLKIVDFVLAQLLYN